MTKVEELTLQKLLVRPKFGVIKPKKQKETTEFIRRLL